MQLRNAGAAATAREAAEIRASAGKLFDAEAAAAANADRMQELRSVGLGVVNTFRQAEASGKGFADSVAAAVENLTQRLEDLAINKAFDLLFSGQGGGGGGGLAGIAGGFLSRLFGGAPAGLLPSTVAALPAGAGLFDIGGWTGNGHPGAPAGIVHGQEFVVRAGPARTHRALLEAINSGGPPAPPYQSGGFVEPGGNGSSLNVSFTLNNQSGMPLEASGRPVPDGRGGVRVDLALKKAIGGAIPKPMTRRGT